MTDQLYRPGSGTEGLIFENRFCSRCIKDKPVRQDPPDYENGCPILAAALILNKDEEGYPKEWVRAPEGDPHWGICTAFEQDPDEEPWDGGRPPFPLPGEIMGAYLAIEPPVITGQYAEWRMAVLAADAEQGVSTNTADKP